MRSRITVNFPFPTLNSRTSPSTNDPSSTVAIPLEIFSFFNQSYIPPPLTIFSTAPLVLTAPSRLASLAIISPKTPPLGTLTTRSPHTEKISAAENAASPSTGKSKLCYESRLRGHLYAVDKGDGSFCQKASNGSGSRVCKMSLSDRGNFEEREQSEHSEVILDGVSGRVAKNLGLLA